MSLNKRLLFPSASTSIYHSSLIMNLDPNNGSSYGGSGSSITDISGSATNYNGTLTGGSFVSGSPSYFSMDSTNKITTSLDLTESSGYTISVWIWDNAGTGVSALERKQFAGSDWSVGNGLMFMIGGNITNSITGEAIYLYQYDTASSPKYFIIANAAGTGAYSDSAWHNVQLAVNTSGTQLVIDGVNKSWNSTSYDIDFTDIQFGGASNDDGNFTPNTVDRIGAIKCYSQKLTLSEMQADYNAEKATYGH